MQYLKPNSEGLLPHGRKLNFAITEEELEKSFSSCKLPSPVEFLIQRKEALLVEALKRKGISAESEDLEGRCEAIVSLPLQVVNYMLDGEVILATSTDEEYFRTGELKYGFPEGGNNGSDDKNNFR